jgi:hypothetical protein
VDEHSEHSLEQPNTLRNQSPAPYDPYDDKL